MNSRAGEHAREIDACLRKWGAAVNRSADSLWEATLRNGRDLPVQARLIEDWLEVDAELASAPVRSVLWPTLEWNGRLDGAAKFALGLSGRPMRVRAEIPLNGGTAASPYLAATLAGFQQAASLAHDDAAREAQVLPGPTDVPAQEGAAAPLQELLADAGWQFAERPGGSLMVDLESGSDYRQARVEAVPDGSLRASAELAHWESPIPASRDALAVLLLTASGAVRMVRPVAETCGNGITARFEIRLASHACPEFLGRGLAALSVACRLCSREAAILNNERIAGRYLAVRGFTSQ